jgi:V/A-type H+/Na+-transporting ATPase subunit D
VGNVKHTKTELKAQKEALLRFERFLPMLQLKKQQLQAELLNITAALAAREAEENERRAGLDAWVRLFCDPVEIAPLVALRSVAIREGNIAGVGIPILDGVDVRKAEYDLFATPPWVDDAVAALERLIRLRVEREILEEQRRLIAEELRVTSQRVNLFEKVRIPECRENIRVIRIFLGDEQTAAVARGKIAKRRAHAEEPEARAA